MILDRPVLDIRFRIKYWLDSLNEEQRLQLRNMDPEESLRSMFECIADAPPMLGRRLTGNSIP